MKKIEIFFKLVFLKWILFFGKRKKLDSKIELQKGEKVLCIRLNRIGDALVVTPLIHAIKKNTDSSITVLADRHNHFVFRNNPDIDEVIVFEKGKNGTKKLIRQLKKSGFSVVLDLHDDVSVTVSYILSKLKIQYIAGLDKENRALYTNLVPRLDSVKHHVIERAFALSELFEKRADLFPNESELEAHKIRYYASEENFSVTRKYFDSKFSPGEFVVGINISAGSMARYWGTENFRRLVRYLKERKIEYLLLCSTRDIKLSLEIDPYSERTYYTPDFGEFCAMLKKINLLFSPDTATVHLASIYSVPVFGLYVKYDTEDLIWYPYNTRYDAIVTKEPTLKYVPWETVIKKFETFLNNEVKFYEDSKL